MKIHDRTVSIVSVVSINLEKRNHLCRLEPLIHENVIKIMNCAFTQPMHVITLRYYVNHKIIDFRIKVKTFAIADVDPTFKY